jgi:tRNA(Ile2) C34 agmatinyltransferase TiaS
MSSPLNDYRNKKTQEMLDFIFKTPEKEQPKCPDCSTELKKVGTCWQCPHCGEGGCGG